MKKPLLVLGCTLSLTVQVAHAQGLMEFNGVRAGAAGMGAGMAASVNNGKVVRRSYEATVKAQQAVVAQTKQIEQYMTLGNQFIGKKEWLYAEKAFAYALQLVARRDGPGSANSVPALRGLAKVNQAQKKVDDAIGYQKKALAISKSARRPDNVEIIEQQRDLSTMLVEKKDYTGAESVLQESVGLCQQEPLLTRAQRNATLKVYGKVLRDLHKEEAAKQVEEAIVSGAKLPPIVSTPSVQAPPSPSVPQEAAAPQLPPLPQETTAVQLPPLPQEPGLPQLPPLPQEPGSPQLPPLPQQAAASRPIDVPPETELPQTAPIAPESAPLSESQPAADSPIDAKPMTPSVVPEEAQKSTAPPADSPDNGKVPDEPAK